MDYFKTFYSNTYGGSANQFYFTQPEGVVKTGRIFYKISVGGKYNYSILFSNTIDSTYSDGSQSVANIVCDSWKIHSAKIGRCKKMPEGKLVVTATMSDDNACNADIYVENLKPLLFNGLPHKNVAPGELFWSDGVEMEFGKDEFLCLEITFSGRQIPYHEETLMPAYTKTENGWEYSKLMPCASMVGCDRRVKNVVGFWGDSITQGCGTPLNGYLHWNSLLASKLTTQNSYWNLGIGYGRADDAATEGAWFLKVKNCDTVFVCFGVNDILKNYDETTIKNNLLKIVNTLKNLGKTVVVQTVPPFDYNGEKKQIWHNVNEFIKNDLAKICDCVFDCVTVLGQCSPNFHMAKYGGHPNEYGCAIWAEALLEFVKHNDKLKNLLI